MTARANWFVAEVEGLDDEPDPFAMPVEEVGERIDLSDPLGGLRLRLVELLRREGNLDAGGVTCAIKGRTDTCCHACPMSEAHIRDSTLGVLCRLGREQERVLTEIAATTERQPSAARG